ncbi:MAG: S41 family peptidase [bacterium]|nr:S41 family peptidase [bacterium]
MHMPLTTVALATALILSTPTLGGDAIEREIVEAIAEAVEENYVYPDKGDSAAGIIRDALASGEYDGLEGDALANAIRGALVEHTRDLHFGVRGLPDGWTPPSSDEEAHQRRAPLPPFGFNAIERLDGNIGYIDLRGFAGADYIAETVESAMRLVQGCETLIFDLRRNGGGDPSAVALITSYLYDPSEPVHLNSLYSRPDDKTTEYWTHDEINTDLAMPDVPVYVLTSGRTFSAAEEFSYNLRNLGRATIVGETTGGGAHPVDFNLLHSEATDRYYQLVLPTARAISPITKANWEGTGVEPHIACEADGALDQALLDAYAKLRAQGNEQVRFGIASLTARLSPLKLSDAQLDQYSGSYTDREVKLEDGKLLYRRVGVSGFRPLVCIDEDTFVIDGFEGFIMEFERAEDGSVGAINGIYQQGHTDRSARDG